MTREELNSKKEMIFEFISSREYKPLSVKEIGAVLQVPAKQKKEYRSVMNELIAEGKIHVDLKGKVKKMSDQLVTGSFMGTQKGYGFVRVEGRAEDIFIPAHATNGAIDGDSVRVALAMRRHGKRQEAEVVSILERGTTMVVGTYSTGKSFGYVVADNQKFTKEIYIAKADTKGAVTGHKVVAEITDYGDENRNPEGRILEILGHVNDPGIDILSVIKAYGLPEEYPDAVMDQIASISDQVLEEQKAGRADYRSLQTVTIDGEDAKDLDDAITLEKDGDFYHLGVHIADVSEYVTENSPLDKEALKRGTSVYLVDRVIPMIPHKLSNGICSLNQGEDRLALSCMMEINGKGEIVRHRIEESVIRVDRRMSYTSVHKIVEEEDEAECSEYQELIPMFRLMYELADILRKRRFKRGSIDFDFPESKIILDCKGRPLDVRIYERNNAHRIIEEFMLAANQTVAEEYFWQELPFVYRTHEAPDSEKIAKLGDFVSHFGYRIKTGQDEEIHPKEIQKLVREAEGKPEEAVVSRLALRSMKQAKYTDSCDGHFGLAMKYYCHFTSPIRRYPDLQIHRIIKENLHGHLSDRRIEHYRQILPEVAAQASQLERRADDAEREVEKMKKAEYMEQFIGESFDGMISGVTTWGIYVELPNTIEGMVRVADLPGDYYYFEEETYQMVGEHTHKTYKLGQPVKIVVDGVDKMLRTIDFVLAEEQETEEPLSKNEKGKAKAEAQNETKRQTEKKKAVSEAAKRQTEKKKATSKTAKRQTEKKEAALKETKRQTEKKEAASKETKRQTEKKEAASKAAKRQTEKKKAASKAAKRQTEKKKEALKAAKRQTAQKAAAKKAAAQKRKMQLAKKEAIEKAFAKKKAELMKKDAARRKAFSQSRIAGKVNSSVKKHGNNPQRKTRNSLGRKSR